MFSLGFTIFLTPILTDLEVCFTVLERIFPHRQCLGVNSEMWNEISIFSTYSNFILNRVLLNFGICLCFHFITAFSEPPVNGGTILRLLLLHFLFLSLASLKTISIHNWLSMFLSMLFPIFPFSFGFVASWFLDFNTSMWLKSQALFLSGYFIVC